MGLYILQPSLQTYSSNVAIHGVSVEHWFLKTWGCTYFNPLFKRITVTSLFTELLWTLVPHDTRMYILQPSLQTYSSNVAIHGASMEHWFLMTRGCTYFKPLFKLIAVTSLFTELLWNTGSSRHGVVHTPTLSSNL